MVYLGAEEWSKAHRFYDPRRGKAHVSRDVVFEEEKKWDWRDEKGEPEQNSVEFILEEAEAVEQEEGESPGQVPTMSSSTETSSLGTSSSPRSPNPGSRMSTPIPESSSSGRTISGDSSIKDGLRGFRPLSDIYGEARELELSPDELLLLSEEEPASYREAATEKERQEAMERES